MKVKKRKCLEKANGCQGEYWPRNGQLWRVCNNPACISKKAERERAKSSARKRSKLAREKKEYKESSMSMRARQTRARKSAQEFSRIRDIKWFESMGKRPRCIMCNRTDVKSWHGAHFIAVGSKGGPRSFHPCNINLSCGQCNFYAAQETTHYRENMIAKYGQEMVDYLETAQLDYTLTVEEIEDIRNYYRDEIKRLKKYNGEF